jgi:hypothetical protein
VAPKVDAASANVAQAQQPGAVKLKADAQNVVKIVSGNKLKIQTYCKIVELSDQIDEEQGSSDAQEIGSILDRLDDLCGD